MKLVDTNVVTGATFAGDTMKHKGKKCTNLALRLEAKAAGLSCSEKAGS